MSIADKFSKRITLISGKDTHTAQDWALLLVEHLMVADWGMPKAIISDRDSKFLSELWKAVFARLNVKLLTSTSYHPQTDGPLERMNQIVEIALRYYLAILPSSEEWPRVLPYLQFCLNNSRTSSGRSANEILCRFRLKEPLDLLLPVSQEPGRTLDHPYNLARVDAADAIALGVMEAKRYYDGTHQAMFLAPGEKAYIWLHQGYTVSGLRSRKSSQQMMGSFTVKRKVGRLAYKLDLPANWKVHPVISIAHLEPAPAGEDPFNRPLQEHPESLEVDGKTDHWEIERLLNIRVTRKGRGQKIQYLVKWRGWGYEYNEWYNLADLQNALELVQECDDRLDRQ